MSKIYDFTMQTAKGEAKNLADYQGKVLLIVNTASRCGLTPQYEELQKIYAQYQEQGLEILDFPCNQFREQAPEGGEEYAAVCQMKFGTKFMIFDKIEVNGEQTHPLYAYLKSEQPEDIGNAKFKDLLIRLASMGEQRAAGDIQWNFTKFLINKQGQVVARFAPSVSPFEMEAEIQKLLAE